MKTQTRFTLRFYWEEVKKYPLLLAILLGTLVLASVAEMAWPVVVGKFFTQLGVGGEKALIVDQLLTVLFWLLLLEVFQWFFRRIFEYTNANFQAKIMAATTEKCFQSLMQQSYRFFNNNFAGSLVKKVNRMPRACEGITDVLVYNFIPMGLKLVMVIAFFFSQSVLIGGVVLIWSSLFLTINYFLSRYKLQFDLAKASSNSRVTGALADAISNNLNVKLFNGLEFEIKRFGKQVRDWFVKTKKSWHVSNHVDAGQAILMIALEIGILYTAIQLWSKDLIGVGAFFVIQAYLFELFHQLWGFGWSIRNFYEHLADAEEMTAILMEKPEVRDRKGAKKLKARAGKVEFRKVSFRYEEKGETVIENLSFTVKAGMKVALIGPSGGGKSTVIRLLLRLHDVARGEIWIDDQNIAKVTQESLREKIALVPQDPLLFHRNLLENIRYGRRDAGDEEVMAAAKMAYCDEFIGKFPDRYKTLVGERGVKLSGGQRQRIAIARAILSNAKILLLDEATSSLDSESEHLIQKALANLMKNKTTFIIAHRLSTIMSVDQILVLREGKIVETGTHADLTKKDGGLYKKLWDLQVGGYL